MGHAGRRRAVRARWLLAALLALAAVVLAWKTPPSWLMTSRQAELHAADWVRERLNAVAIGTAAAIATALLSWGIWRQGRRDQPDALRHVREESELKRAHNERTMMLKQVRYKWSPLQPSEELGLSFQPRPDAVQPGGRVIRRAGEPPTQARDGITIATVFDQAAGGLLILGAPGAGKTTLLLQLAEELLRQAEQDNAQPIPVVFNLSSWAAQCLPLENWLEEQLKIDYVVPSRTASAWVEHNALTLLLDGLDEVLTQHRAACVEAINAYRRDHGLVPVAVCSRTQDYFERPPSFERPSSSLVMQEAVELLPLTDAQINEYLDRMEEAGASLAGVRAAHAEDETLQELMRSPLMLRVM